MDTISRENNSMLPVGAIIVGAIGLLLGGLALVQLSKVKQTLAEHDAKVVKVDAVESQATTANAAAEKAGRDIRTLTTSTQDAVTQIGNMLSDMKASVTKLEEAAKKTAVPVTQKKAGSGEPAVAGPGEYVVKAGDTGMKIATANGVSVADLQAVNSGVNWNGLRPGQKLKLPKK